ncbi:MAG TPA: glycoside hydrolase family 95 protein [Bryobacteraceae bacterium]|nr:glycoside hydrolase family 95 protein [Bryobacteraceae bacterium]
MKNAAFALAAFCLALPAGAQPQTDMKWWYQEPAARYWEAVPLSNGMLAAMVYGRTRDELIPLNDASLWSGSPYDPNNPEGLASLPEIRRLLLAGEYVKAQALCDKLLSRPKSVQHYQPLGEIRLRFEGADGATAYRRELDMDSAEARVTFTAGGVHYTREVFTSYPDEALVMRISADQPGKISLAARLASIQPSGRSETAGSDGVEMSGTAQTVTTGASANPTIPATTRWYARMRIIPEGGKLGSCRVEGDEERTAACVSVTGANAATLILTAATSYRNWQDNSGDPRAIATARMTAAATKPYADLLARHLRDWQPQFRTVRFDLGGHEAAETDTTTRIDRLRKGGEDPLYTAQYFQYGRYLLLAVSRAGALPFNNHNVWLDNMEGRWQGRFTLNINLQECYWPAENTNMAQTNEALLDFTANLAQAGARTAKELYGARGWVAHHGTDVWLNTAPTDLTGPGIWPTGGAWLVDQLWDHYAFQPDTAYLKRLYPLLKGASEFFLDYLIEEPTHHWLVTAPSVSPENSFFTPAHVSTQVGMGPTMDNQLLRDLFDHTADAAAKLGVDAELRSQVEAARKRLPPDRVGKHGQVQEWLEDFDEPEVTHRHLSPLYGFFPSNQITEKANPELVKAVGVTLQRRGDGNLGWSGAWKINLYARLGDGDHAESILRKMLTDISLHPSREDSDRVPSIDGNQGIQGVTAGIAEMLLQSQNGELDLLPALPKAWPSGSISGLRARGGFVVDLAWERGELTRVRVVSNAGQECVLRYRENRVSFRTRAGQAYVRNGQLK